MKSTLKISEHRHNGSLQSRVYYPKGSLNNPKGGYKWYRSKAQAELAILEHNALQKRFGELAKDVTIQELVEAYFGALEFAGDGSDEDELETAHFFNSRS